MDDLVNQYEIAERFGVGWETVKKWRQRSTANFPEPDGYGSVVRSDQPVWLWTTVVIWAMAFRPQLLTNYMEKVNAGHTGKYRVTLEVTDDDRRGDPIREVEMVVPLRVTALHLFDLAEAALGYHFRPVFDTDEETHGSM